MGDKHYLAYISVVILWTLAAGCVAKPGNIYLLVDLPRAEPQPTSPHAPLKPEAFPPVSLVWERTHAKAPTVAWNLKTRKAPVILATEAVALESSNESTASSSGLVSVELHQEPVPTERKFGPFSLPAEPDNPYELAFDQATVRALRALVNAGRDDPSLLEALTAKLVADDTLEALRPEWLPTLRAARENARTTMLIREPLHLLQRAFRKARFDGYYGIYRGIDIASCRWAARRSMELLPQTYDQSFEVVIRELGRHSLASVATLCEQALVVELSEREFPALKGKRKLRRLVEGRYAEAHPNLEVHRVSVPNGWEKDGTAYLLRAAIGVERVKDFPQTKCSIEEVELLATYKRQLGKPECCEVIRSLPIDCERIR